MSHSNFIHYGPGRITETVGTKSLPLPIFPESQAQKYNAQIQIGIVHQVIRGTYCYRVVFEGYTTPIVCTSSCHYSVLQSVVSESYPVGSRVVVLLNHGYTHGLILGAVPTAYIPDIAQSIQAATLVSGIGSYHYKWSKHLEHFLENRPLSEGLSDYAYHRTADHLQGDFTISNIFGGGFHTDPFMTFVRQSHSCGLWMFWADNLLRLMGTSIQEYSAMHERYAGVDEGESYLFEGIALYPWEGLGLLVPEGVLYEKHEPMELLDRKGIGFAEPAERERVPFYRRQFFSGFVGQGQVDYLFLPPKSLKETDHPIAVSRTQSLMDGTLLFESAKGVHLIKHGNIRSFKRVRAIEDPQGDDLAKGTYEFSQTPVPDPLPKDASITDQILHAVRQQANVGFEGHVLDFEKIPEEQESFEKDVNLAPLQSLRSQSEIPKPPAQKLYVDERYGETEYSGSRASFSLLPDGGFVIRGGCGEEIRAQGGNITISAPGDLRCFLGRSAVTLAGDDIILRAKNSADITATDHDVRIKAERNLDMVGGMSGNGRTLLENQAKGLPNIEGIQGQEGENIRSSGVMLRAAESVITSLGKRIYTRSLSGGEIFIDADHGEGNFLTRARYVGMHAQSNVALGVGETPNLLQLNRSSALVTGRMEVDGSILSSKRVLADLGCNQNPMEPPNFDEERLKQIDDLKESFTERHGEHLHEKYDGDQGLGSPEMVEANTFSFRNSQQCGAHRFRFEEPYWMELYGMAVVTTFATWEEPLYSYQGTINQTAWPGHEKWVNDPCVAVGKTTLYDAESGKDGDRVPSEQEQQSMTPAEFYRVITT